MTHKLRINDSPVSTYLGYACSLSIILQYEKGEDWFIQNYIDIVTSYKEDYSEISMDFLNLSNVYFNSQEAYQPSNILCPLLSTYSVPKEAIEADEIVNFIINQLKKGYYICLYLNRKYLSMINQDVMHDVFVYGYDDIENYFFIGEYKNKKKYSEIKCGFNEFVRAYENTKNVLTDFHNFFEPNTNVSKINLLCFNDSYPIKLDFPLMAEKLGYYLKPQKLSINFKIGIYPIREGYDLKVCTGCSNYVVMKKYINRKIMGNEEIDYRQLHLFYEHKKLHAYRIEYLTNRGVKIKTHLFMQCNDLIRKALILRNTIIKYNLIREKNFHNIRSQFFLEQANELLKEIYKKEKNIIRDIIDALTEY